MMKSPTFWFLLVAGGLAACNRGGGAAAESSTVAAPTQPTPAPAQPSAADAAQPAAEAAHPAAAAEAPSAAGSTQPADAAADPTKADGGFLELAGVASAVRNTRLSMKAGGVLSSIKVREGTWVARGQPLCSLDTVDLVIRVEGAQVAAKQAQAGVTNARQDLNRAKELYKGGAATDQVIEKAELGLTMASLQADAANVALKAAQQALYDATLRAPFAGAVTKVLAEEGMMITTMPPTAIFQLVDTTVLEVRVPIPERMLSLIKVGQPVVVSLPAMKIVRQGKIDRIPEVVDSATRSVEALIRLDNKERAIPAGLYARVRFPGVRPDDGAPLPEGALSGGQP